MPSNKKPQDQAEQVTSGIIQQVSRRRFLGYVGATSALVAGVAACKKNDDNTTNNSGVNLGSGDVGILNYAYALEQLEAAFYTQVVLTPYANISPLEMEYLTDIRNHEVGHREFFKAAITAAAPSQIIPSLAVNFSSINFSSRDSVLATAQAFEDLGVTAYNGAGYLIVNPAYLTLAGQIVSVEARHAALIADLIADGTFANTTDAMGLDGARTPSEVLTIAKTYIVTQLDASHLPS